jgi:hypothetical protein
MRDRARDLNSFYALLGELERRCRSKRRLAECDGRMRWPTRGVYFFFEDGEVRSDGSTPRVVRVGTHALRPARSTLWNRLAQHRGSLGGRRPGGGNHRGSIFRHHVGTALLSRDVWDSSISQSWGRGDGRGAEARGTEYPLEQAVSIHVRSMPFLWLAVDDPPGAGSARGEIEAGTISLLSNAGRVPIDPPSALWLGRCADHKAIRFSGLWNVDHVFKEPEPSCLDVLARWVHAMDAGR